MRKKNKYSVVEKIYPRKLANEVYNKEFYSAKQSITFSHLLLVSYFYV